MRTAYDPEQVGEEAHFQLIKKEATIPTFLV